MSQLEEELAFQLEAVGIPYEREYKFCPGRKWRADFYIKPMILVELEGIIYRPKPGQKSRHTTPTGFEDDAEKYDEAEILRFNVLRFTQKHVKSGWALQTIERLIEVKREWSE
jgi:hypothetical protein